MLETKISTGVWPAEAEELQRLAKDKYVIEFGTWHGYSTLVMAQVARQVVTVDWHHGDEEAGVEETLNPYMDNLTKYGLRDRVVSVVGQFDQVAPFLRPGIFDMGFLDGKHDKKSVLRDLSIMGTLMSRRGNVLACHDYDRDHWSGTPFGVKDAIEAWPPFQLGDWVGIDLVESLYVMKRVS